MLSRYLRPQLPAQRTEHPAQLRCSYATWRLPLVVAFAAIVCCIVTPQLNAQLKAGAAKVDITRENTNANDRLFVRALVLNSGDTTTAIVTVDAVAIAEIGSIKNEYLGNVRKQLQEKLRIQPTNVIINASHCHGVVCEDIEQRTVQAVVQAMKRLEPVHVGAGVGHEDRISANRRLQLKDGRVIDVRHAYSMPPDSEVAKVGPIDPEIGILRLDRPNGETVAVVYNFACHPIQGVPSRGNTADITGFSSKVIEENLAPGAIALFVQGCGGDINPAFYKDVDHPRDAEPLGNMLGLSTLRALRKVKTKADDRLVVRNQVIELPRADTGRRIEEMQTEQQRLLASLGGTSLSLKTFLPLVVKYNLSTEFPSYYSHRYLAEKELNRAELANLDAENRANIRRYIRNIHTMEQLTRINTNLRLLRRHHARSLAAPKRTLEAELVGVHVGDFVLTTFPGELVVEIGLGIKKRSPHKHTFVAGYTNGYIFYSPTAKQLQNAGNAQEDSDCMLAPEWQKIFEAKVDALLKEL